MQLRQHIDRAGAPSDISFTPRGSLHSPIMSRDNTTARGQSCTPQADGKSTQPTVRRYRCHRGRRQLLLPLMLSESGSVRSSSSAEPTRKQGARHHLCHCSTSVFASWPDLITSILFQSEKLLRSSEFAIASALAQPRSCRSSRAITARQLTFVVASHGPGSEFGFERLIGSMYDCDNC